MTDPPSSTGRDPLVLTPGAGPNSPMGRMSAVFKADRNETPAYSISD